MRATDPQPARESSSVARARELLTEARAAEAVSLLRRRLADDPRDSAAALMLAKALVLADRLPEAAETLEAIARQRVYEPGEILLVRIAMVLGNWVLAERAAVRGVAHFPQSVQLRELLAEVRSDLSRQAGANAPEDQPTRKDDLSAIKEAGMKVGLALNPATPLSVLDYVLPQLDMVLIMSVNPGFGGQSFIPFCKDKVKNLAAEIRRRGLDTMIQLDGGVTLDNAQELFDLGADVLVSGSAFFGYPPYRERHQAFQNAMK